MKKLIAYLFLAAYSLLLLRPAAPFIADALAHLFWYSQHIATVHFENGKYHVHYQYMNESKKSFPGKNATVGSDIFSGDYLIRNEAYDFSISPVQKDLCPLYLSSLTTVYLTTTGPPPKV